MIFGVNVQNLLWNNGDIMEKIWIKLIVSLIVVLAIIGGPIVINECYKLDSKYVMLLNVSDILSYYGMILGTTATIIAIIVTINFNRKQIERESYLNREIDKWLKMSKSFL